MINRSRNDILAELLGALEKYGETSRTRIMYHAMLSNDQSKSYILFLLERGLVTNSPDKPKWLVITKKGQELLNVINEMNKMVTHSGGGADADKRSPYPSHMISVEKPVPRKWTEPVASDIASIMPILRPSNQSPKPGKELIETAKLLTDKVRERKDVRTLWDSGIHSDVKMAKVLGLNRGVVYNHLRRLGLKPNKKSKKG